VGVAVFTVYSAIHSLVENWDRLSLGHEL
jgi:hypothetical protein